MGILEFVFQSFWHFAGALLLIATVLRVVLAICYLVLTPNSPTTDRKDSGNDYTTALRVLEEYHLNGNGLTFREYCHEKIDGED